MVDEISVVCARRLCIVGCQGGDPITMSTRGIAGATSCISRNQQNEESRKQLFLVASRGQTAGRNGSEL